MPSRLYSPAEPIDHTGGALVVHFSGDDGREKTFVASSLPLPGWHAPLAAAWAVRVGPTGSLRTRASATTAWSAVCRFLRTLADLPDPPGTPSQLTVGHLVAYQQRRLVTTAESNVWLEMRTVSSVLMLSPLVETVPRAAVDFAGQRVEGLVHYRPQPGYSDAELRRLIGAARTDVARLRDRLDAGEHLLRGDIVAPRPADDPPAGPWLEAMAATGVPPLPEHPANRLVTFRLRAAMARQLFVVQPDLAAMLTLLVAVTGRNVETIKELPAEHTIRGGRAVELRLVKRRRGPRRWNETVTWEIGPPGRELHTPGGLYLLLHRLTARSRVFSGSVSLWSIWRQRLLPPFPAGAIGHADPFAVDLSGSVVDFHAWAGKHNLDADVAAAGDGPPPLRVHMGRLRTSIEVRRTRQVGGHLPSAARSNTIPVLFRNYLRGDPTTIDWAQDVIGSALLDAERAALAAHRRSLDPLTSSPVVRPAIHDAPMALGQQETGWTACTDPDEHPRTGKPCQYSFLDCFHCSNCLVTADHLPRLLGLLAALRERRAQLDEQQWWHRYGPAWTAIRHDILVRFTPAQIDHAQRLAPPDAILDLVENPWERT